MSRSDSIVGLSPRAKAMIRGATLGKSQMYNGLCTEFPLHRYTLSDGRQVREVIQADVWSGGPSWFFTLAGFDGSAVAGADWTDQEIADYMGEEYGEALPAITADDASMFAGMEDAIESGQTCLSYDLADKYKRWRAERAAMNEAARGAGLGTGLGVEPGAGPKAAGLPAR